MAAVIQFLNYQCDLFYFLAQTWQQVSISTATICGSMQL